MTGQVYRGRTGVSVTCPGRFVERLFRSIRCSCRKGTTCPDHWNRGNLFLCYTKRNDKEHVDAGLPLAKYCKRSKYCKGQSHTVVREVGARLPMFLGVSTILEVKIWEEEEVT